MRSSPAYEILAPGGSLDHALWALEGGAHAVYVGFQKFSARSHANNLNLDDMAALTAVARAKGARVFCALNTILGTDELVEGVSLAWQLYYRGVDALIVQDLGLAGALVRHGPPVHLHASTQAAVHNPGGVAALKALGFCRVVLARELTMAEIGAIVAADPEMEYEVFVHGALCYAVSGNCMASGMMIGRSANRGDCGQVCRTKFELDYLIPGPQRKHSPHEEGLPEGIHAPPGEVTWKHGEAGAFASMNDLELGSRIRELHGLGVQSFKIEGRMKPPAYSYNTARAYRAFLEGGRDAEAWEWLDEARLRYGRLPSSGWFDGHKALAQTNPEWAGTLGMPLGTITSANEKGVRVATVARAALYKTLGRGDGVMILGPQPGQVFRGALAGPTPVSGTQAELTVSERLGFDPRGGSAWLISRHDGKLPVKKAGKPYRHPVPLRLTLEPDATGVRLVLSTPAFDGLSLTEALPAEPARGDRTLESSLSDVLHASDSAFGPSELAVDNRAGSLFVQPKLLKEWRRRWYAAVEAAAETHVARVAATVRDEAAAQKTAVPSIAPVRAGLSPLLGVNRLTGFVTEWESLKPDQLPATPWGLSLPLAPFTPNEESYYLRLRDFLVRAREDGIAVLPGLSNPCHLTWVKRLREEGFELPHWYVDWGFHAANPWTAATLGGLLPGLVFAVHWVEDPQTPDRSYFPPLFTSRSCMLRNSFGVQDAPSASAAPTSGNLGFGSREWLLARQAGLPGARPAQGPRCPAGCAGHFSARLVQGKTSFRVEARDCVNYLLLEDGPQAP